MTDTATPPRYSRLKDRYQIVSLIGRGGLASVYLARDEFLGRDVAVKLFDASVGDPASLARQEQELRVLARLNHHSLVSLLDAGVSTASDPQRAQMFLVMELVRGSTLKARMVSGELSRREIGLIGTDLAEGLEYIHQNGIVHRDVKPANILMVAYTVDDPRPRAKLADFGIALLAHADRVTGEGATTGTAAYLSPEQALGDPLGAPSDIYSLGLVLLECFTGKIAFPGAPVPSAVARLLRDPEISADVPEDWRQLLSAMTAREAADRPVVRDVILTLQQITTTEMARHSAVDVSLLPPSEASRMLAVERYEILDTPADGAFDRITALAARLFNVPIAIVSIVDRDRIWFKSHVGLEVDEIARDPGLCASAILHDSPWVVENAEVDPRVLANPLVAGELGISFYAGVPLHTHDGHNLGTLCVLDYVPREITAEEVMNLEDLAAMVMSELELRLATRRALRDD